MSEGALRRRRLVAAALGNALETYDFTCFAFFAPFIARAFFPATDPFASLMLTLSVFAIGFVARPMGGIVIGRIADRAGRKRAMLITIALMTVGMMVIAGMPSYHQIGVIAPIMIAVARAMQGLAYGGETGAAAAFVVESAPAGKRNLYLGVLNGAAGMGAILAGASGAGMAALLSTADFEEWGWRIPFALGLLAVPVGLYMRRHLPDARVESDKVDRRSLGELFREDYYPLILGILMIGSTSITVYVSYYMSTYAITELHFSNSASISISMASGVATIVGCIIGTFADRIGEIRIIVASRLLLCLACYFLFNALLAHPAWSILITTAAVMMLILSMSTNAILSLISMRFGLTERATAIGFCFAMGGTLFGGTAQPIAAWFSHQTGDPMSIAYYLIGANLIGLLAAGLLSRQIVALRAQGRSHD